ncbi:MAG: MBL fold metallo-hydrolase [Candidatus Bathyarchaeota archaeon]|jgi:7,8-dihydropterin-6-yl-methyl-4-(beta-D-ribofuranosyl)aminobenzene 5'-phosphate synthase
MSYIAFLSVPLEKLEGFVENWEPRPPVGDMKIITPPQTLLESVGGFTGFVIFESDNYSSLIPYLKGFESIGAEVRLVPIMENLKLSKKLTEFKEAKLEAERQWSSVKHPKITDIGATERLEILPLVEWHSSRDDLKVETGVSYLVRTDEGSILFDLGLNRDQEDPSPLLQNMETLELGLDDFDTLVISHNHGDHVGGGRWAEDKTFSLTGRQIELENKRVYTPVPMTYPGLDPVHTEGPTEISDGVWTIGTIPNSLFGRGITHEQSLAVNVEGKGVVVIVGCGHQTLPKILERTEALFDEPILGLVGGLHYPVTGGPISIFGLAPHKLHGTGKLPWDHVTMEEVRENIRALKARSPGLVALSAHDSCEASIETFREAFPHSYRDIKVGEAIIV